MLLDDTHIARARQARLEIEEIIQAAKRTVASSRRILARSRGDGGIDPYRRPVSLRAKRQTFRTEIDVLADLADTLIAAHTHAKDDSDTRTKELIEEAMMRVGMRLAACGTVPKKSVLH